MEISPKQVGTLDSIMAGLRHEAENIRRMVTSMPMGETEQHEFGNISHRLSSMADSLAKLKQEIVEGKGT
jgi:hypothetical protein